MNKESDHEREELFYQWNNCGVRYTIAESRLRSVPLVRSSRRKRVMLVQPVKTIVVSTNCGAAFWNACQCDKTNRTTIGHDKCHSFDMLCEVTDSEITVSV